MRNFISNISITIKIIRNGDYIVDDEYFLEENVTHNVRIQVQVVNASYFKQVTAIDGLTAVNVTVQGNLVGMGIASLAIWNQAVDALLDRETFVDLERGIEDYLILFLRKAKYFVFGPEPIFAYVLARRRELSLVRLVGVSKINLIPVTEP